MKITLTLAVKDGLLKSLSRSVFGLLVCAGLVACASTNADNTAHSMSQLVTDRAAHWISNDVFLLPPEVVTTELTLINFVDGRNTSGEIQRYPIKKIDAELRDTTAPPHLQRYSAYRLSVPSEITRKLVKGDLYIDAGDRLHGVQIGGALDALFTQGSADADEAIDLGASPHLGSVAFAVWAPTARRVQVALYDKTFNALETVALQEDVASGVWRTKIQQQPQRARFYQYRVDVVHYATGKLETLSVTDPYSLGLSANSRYSMIVDLDAPETKPTGWDTHPVPALLRPEQHIIYEAHIGDFSAYAETIPAVNRAGYKAFQYADSAPMIHLKKLTAAGLNTFHLLPAYDIGTVNENPAERLSLRSTVAEACAVAEPPALFCDNAQPTQTLQSVLESYNPNSADAQALVEAINEHDDFNWGYDPVHYTVPEGSYASNANDISRTIEFRQMVQTLHQMGLRVIMDVVYNHTYKAGLNPLSVLDKIVPGYYHRLDPVTGTIEQSTCCENTATERVMMDKLMRDSLVVWARDYKIDGFRFDLMGHQPKAAMLLARDEVRAIDPDTYFYGEGWNFGEVANNAQFVQASQTELAGTSIGTFNDRLRDGVRGGSSFVDGDALRRGQGIGTGQVVDPNELNTSIDLGELDRNLALTKIGLVGNLQDYELTQRDGSTVRGDQIPYGDGGAGYALDPADTINYVSKHDNQTLWDNNQYRLPFTMSAEQRARLQLQGLSYPLLAQGIPFLHMGSELARSKSFLRDSYNFGHWFNRVDFNYQDNNYNVGLPPAIKDEKNWPIIRRILKSNQGRDQLSSEQIQFLANGFMDLLAIRSQSPLLWLPTADDIKQRVAFINDGPAQVTGLIAMSIDDGFSKQDLNDLDKNYSQLIVIFNYSPQRQRLVYPAAEGLEVHPRQQASRDSMLHNVRISGQDIVVPGYTTVVLVRPSEGGVIEH